MTKASFYNLQDERATQPIGDNDSTGKEQTTTPTQASIVAAQQENSTSPTPTLKPTNGTSAQANQSLTESSQKTVDTQNELVIPLLIVAVAAYIIVVIIVSTYKSKNQPNKRKVSK